MTCEFSLAHYEEILDRIQSVGRHRIVTVSDVANALCEEDFILLRHDLDIAVEPAIEMARAEEARGVRTCYYVRLHAPHYNAMDAETLDLLLEIEGRGHELGLHYEPGWFQARNADVADGIRADIATLESLLGHRLPSISQHEPSMGPVLGDLPSGYPCAYQRHLIVGINYHGDSGFKWREGCLCKKIETVERMHILIHPENWIRPQGTWEDALRYHARSFCDATQKRMETHIESQRIYLANRDRLDAERRERYD